MSKKRKKSKKHQYRQNLKTDINRKFQRDAYRIANRRAEPVLRYSDIFDDRRLFHPKKHRLPLTTLGAQDTLEATSRNVPLKRERIQFVDNKKNMVCKRRRDRRRSLFALKRTGKGAANPKRIRNWLSDISCKRR
jgi:hypothetical protein